MQDRPDPSRFTRARRISLYLLHWLFNDFFQIWFFSVMLWPSFLWRCSTKPYGLWLWLKLRLLSRELCFEIMKIVCPQRQWASSKIQFSTRHFEISPPLRTARRLKQSQMLSPRSSKYQAFIWIAENCLRTACELPADWPRNDSELFVDYIVVKAMSGAVSQIHMNAWYSNPILESNRNRQ